MRKLLPAVAVVVAAALSFSVPAIAKGHGGHFHGGHFHAAHMRGHVHAGHRRGHYRLARLRRSRFGDRDDHLPPGWSHGRKVGWDGRDMPPGLERR